jgi:hypothetical protein
MLKAEIQEPKCGDSLTTHCSIIGASEWKNHTRGGCELRQELQNPKFRGRKVSGIVTWMWK